MSAIQRIVLKKSIVSRDIVANLTPDSEWRIDVRDEIGKGAFQLSDSSPDTQVRPPQVA